MQHFFDCDNCGKKVETHCFDNSNNIVTYYTPPILVREITTEKELGEYLVKMAASAMTTLCKECIQQ